MADSNQETARQIVDEFFEFPHDPNWLRIRIAAALRSAAADARKQEREECAKIAEDWRPGHIQNWENADTHIAAAIRASHP